MKPAIEVIGYEKCAGCFACYNACPFNAIDMKISDEGFYVPIVDFNKCTECGLCQNHCPVLKRNTDNVSDFPETFAAWSKDPDVRMSSSSGGVFSELALEIIKRGGVVFGAAWNSDFLVEHICVELTEELSSLKGSKYIQSDIGNSYKRVLEELKKGKIVLFSGTPCQVAAVKTFTNSDHLITADLICHGVPSIAVFRKYLEYRSRGKEIKRINFRDKKAGWSKFSILLEYTDGSSYSRKFNYDDFYWGFNNNYYLNNLCYECPFSTLPRQGDVTLGDFWGAPKELKDEKGVSAIIVNTEKGKNYIKNLNTIEMKSVDFDIVAKGNPRLTMGKQKRPETREQLLKELEDNDFKYISKKYLKHPGEIEVFFKRVASKILRKLKIKR